MKLLLAYLCPVGYCLTAVLKGALGLEVSICGAAESPTCVLSICLRSLNSTVKTEVLSSWPDVYKLGFIVLFFSPHVQSEISRQIERAWEELLLTKMWHRYSVTRKYRKITSGSWKFKLRLFSKDWILTVFRWLRHCVAAPIMMGIPSFGIQELEFYFNIFHIHFST